MKKIVALLLAMVITAALLAGGTAAYASVYIPVTPNITVEFDGAAVSKNLSAPNALWEPGFSTYTNIRIDGDSDFNWSLTFADGDNTEILPDVIDVYWAPTAEVKGMTRSEAMAEMKHLGTLKELLNGQAALTGNSDTGLEQNITIALKMRESAGNDYQGKTAQFSFTVTVSAKTGSN